jgi:type II secretory pathway component GspD/PulD (secretin)
MNFEKSIHVLAAAALAATLSLAQEANPDARVSLRVKERTLADVVSYLQQQSGANIVLKKGGEKTIDLELTDVPWRDALTLATELAGCIVETRTAGLLVIDEPRPVTYAIKDGNVRDVIETIAKLSGANIVVAPEVQGSLSLNLRDVPWRDALDVTAKTLGFTIVEENRGILRVVDPLSLQTQMITRSYQLRYIRPPSKYEPVLASEFVLNTQQTKKSQQQGANQNPSDVALKKLPIFGALQAALTSGGQIDYVEAQKVLIVRDTAQVHDTVKAILERLDTEPAQVFVDVKFVSTTNNDLFNLGVDYGDNGLLVTMTGGQIPITFPFDPGSGGWDDWIIANPTGQGPWTDPALNAGATIIPDTIFGALDFQQVSATLRMLQRDTKSEVVQAPKLIALDGREATIFVGETIRYAEAKTEQGQAGGLSLSITEAAGSPVEVGFQLLIVPHVVPGSDKLTLDVIPKETSLSGAGATALAPAGFDVFTVGASGASGSIALPRKRSSTIVTSMLLTSGQTAVIGGLTSDTDTEVHSEVPFLADIPLLGELFQHDNKTREKRSLIVFITPTIVRSSFDQERLLREEIEKRKGLYKSELEKMMLDDLRIGTAAAPEPITSAAAHEVMTLTATPASSK